MVIDFANRLKEPASIHWHGLRIENAMDGVPGVTQDPVGPGENFIYRLKLEDAGTFWYHPHFNTGRDLMHDGRWSNAPTINGKFRPEYQVKPGERIRLRLINGANARIFSPHIEGLLVDVIAVDGKPVTQIFPLKRVVLSPGNRIDLDITIPEHAGGKIFTVEDNFTRKPFQLASIKVKQSEPVNSPKFTPPTEASFIPAHMFKKVKVEKTWYLNAIRGGKYGIGWTMNQKLWPDADKADYPIGVPRKIIFKNRSSRLHPMHIHGVFF